MAKHLAWRYCASNRCNDVYSQAIVRTEEREHVVDLPAVLFTVGDWHNIVATYSKQTGLRMYYNGTD